MSELDLAHLLFGGNANISVAWSRYALCWVSFS